MKTGITSYLIQVLSLLTTLEISERTITDLALIIEVSKRTIERCIHVIRSAGFAVVENSSVEYTLLNSYGVPRLCLTDLEIKALIITCIDYYALLSQMPTTVIVSGLFKLADSAKETRVPFLKEKLLMDECEIIPCLFNKCTPIPSVNNIG